MPRSATVTKWTDVLLSRADLGRLFQHRLFRHRLFRQSRYSFELLLERRFVLFVVVDVIVLLQSILAALFGAGDLESLYRSSVVFPILLLGVPTTASAVALERRAGSLDLALAVPSTERYFVRRVAPVAVFLLVQAWLLLVVAHVVVYEEDFFGQLLSAKGLFVLPMMLHAALVAALMASVTLFWAARISTTGGAMTGACLTLAVFSKWIFASPVLTGLGPTGTWWLGVVPPDLVRLGWNFAVLAGAAVLFFLYARERLRRPEKMLT